MQITQRAITFDGDTYNLKSNNSSKLSIPKHYYGEKNINEVNDEEESGEDDEELENEEEDDTNEWNIQSV